MKQRRYLIPHILLTIVFILASGTQAESSLYNSMRKYKNEQVSPRAIEKLAQYDHLIRYFSGFSYFLPKHKVSPNFIRALILAESGADHLAVSDKNALGLSQILFTTGVEAAKELAQSQTHFRYVSKDNLHNLTAIDLFDPAINILLTCYLVAKYNYKFDGKLELVVSAWNAGENTQALSQGRHAPYQETENLIGKVNAYYLYFLKNGTFR
jgi:soluble lytic murein transglycosylase-like protein